MHENKDRVEDWASDYDIFDPEYVRDPLPIWNELRSACPIAHSTRWGGSWLATRYEDVQAMVRMVPALSNKAPIVVPPPPEMRDEIKAYGVDSPPITSDPPEQILYRRLILPFFAPQAVAAHREFTRALCHQLIDGFIADGRCDAAADYAQQLPPQVIAHLLGIDRSRCAEFVEWVRGTLELGLTQPQVRIENRRMIRAFFAELVSARRIEPRDDIISKLLEAHIEGQPISDQGVIGICNLLLVAGIDTTWNSIGSALWHLASHAEHRRRLVAEPELLPTAIEELLRFYSPVTMARKVTEPVSIGAVTFQPGDRVLLSFPAANHDPSVFERADEVVLDRQRNRHIAFGVGIHRCAGSNLARMEMEIALQCWLERIPEFELSDADAVTWAGGQVRGPRSIPVRFSTS